MTGVKTVAFAVHFFILMYLCRYSVSELHITQPAIRIFVCICTIVKVHLGYCTSHDHPSNVFKEINFILQNVMKFNVSPCDFDIIINKCQTLIKVLLTTKFAANKVITDV